MPGAGVLQSPCFLDLLHKIRNNAREVVVLKLHNYICANANISIGKGIRGEGVTRPFT